MAGWRSNRRGFWRAVAFLAALVVVLPLLARGASAAGDNRIDGIEVSTANYPTVKLTFGVTAADGQPIYELDRGAFTVTEGGQPQTVVSAYPLRNGTTPLSVMLAFDTSAGMKDEGKLDKAKVAARAFIGQMRPIDRVGLLKFDSAVSVVAPFSGDRAGLSKQVDGLTAQGNTRLYDALMRAIDEVATAEGSRAVVLVTDGQDTESAADLRAVLALAREKGIRVYAIGVGSDIDERVLTQIAQTSGGAFLKAPTANDIAAAFKLLSDQLRNRYELTYTAPGGAAEGTTIELQVVADTPVGPAIGTASYRMPAYTPRAQAPSQGGGQLRPVSAEPVTPLSGRAIYVAPTLLGFGILLIFAGLAVGQSRRARQQRLRHFLRSDNTAAQQEEGDSLLGAIVVGGLRVFSAITTRLLPPSHIRKLSHNLIVAGNPYGLRVGTFVAIKAVLALVLPLLFAVLFFARLNSPFRGIVLIVTLGLLGFYLPNIWLGARMKRRQAAILKALPDALDLLSIGVEAGLGLDGALLEVVNKWDNPLADEFAIVLAELKMGRSRKEALRAMAGRTDLQEITTFTSALIQADELGMGIARPLALQAQQMRMKRRQRAEKLAHEAAVKMLIPMVFFIMPALFIVILGPSISQIGALFGVTK